MLATDYPLLNIMITTLWFFLFVAWIWVFIAVIGDIFRSPDMSGLAKGLWVVALIFLPVLGAVIYLIARGRKMAEHGVQDAEARDAAFRQYVQNVATEGPSTADELGKLAALHDKGVINDAEYETQRAKVLA